MLLLTDGASDSHDRDRGSRVCACKTFWSRACLERHWQEASLGTFLGGAQGFAPGQLPDLISGGFRVCAANLHGIHKSAKFVPLFPWPPLVNSSTNPRF